MNPFNFIIAVLLIIFGLAMSGQFIGLLKFWIEKKHENKQDNLLSNPDFLRALREFKEKTDRRLTDVETIISDMNLTEVNGDSDSAVRMERIRSNDQETKISWPDMDDADDESTDPEPGKSGNQLPDKKLQNMLNKSKV